MSKIFLEFNEITENKNPKSFKIEVKDKEEIKENDDANL